MHVQLLNLLFTCNQLCNEKHVTQSASNEGAAERTKAINLWGLSLWFMRLRCSRQMAK